MTGGGERVDLALNHLCLTRTRSEAKRACEAGAVLIDGRTAKPSDLLRPGATLALRFPRKVIEVRVDTVPERQVSRQAAREMYTILREDRIGDDDGG